MSEQVMQVDGVTVVLRPADLAMNPKVKRLWVEALRSGEYEQAQGALAVADGGAENYRFCCLGVLCDLAVKAGVDVTIETVEDGRGQDRLSYDDAVDEPPASVLTWAGVKSFDDPVAWPTDNYSQCGSGLIALNDGDHYIYDPEVDGRRIEFGFEEIADIIEATY